MMRAPLRVAVGGVGGVLESEPEPDQRRAELMGCVPGKAPLLLEDVFEPIRHVSVSEVVCTRSRGTPGLCRRVWTRKRSKSPARNCIPLHSRLHKPSYSCAGHTASSAAPDAAPIRGTPTLTFARNTARVELVALWRRFLVAPCRNSARKASTYSQYIAAAREQRRIS
jgi:hypothetical protein